MALLDHLKDLFIVDQQVRGLSSGLESAQRRVHAQQSKLDQIQQHRDDVQKQLRHTRAKVNEAEHAVQAADEKINHSRELMNNVKTNKEYSALLVEVNTLKADKAKREEEQLELMGQVETFEAELAAVEGQLAEQLKIKELADKELADRQAEVGDRLAELREQRAQAAAKVPADAVETFNKLADAHDGEAMAPVHEEDRRRMEYCCGGCYMQIPVEKINLLARGDTVVTCGSCARILYLENELKETFGAKSNAQG